MLKGRSMANRDAKDQSFLATPKSPRTPGKVPERPIRCSTGNEKRSRSSSRRDCKRRSLSASSRPRKEKTRGTKKTLDSSQPVVRLARMNPPLTGESLRSFGENDPHHESLVSHHDESGVSACREEVRQPKRERGSAGVPYRRHSLFINADDLSLSASSRDCLASTAQKPHEKRVLLKAQSSRDFIQRRNKSRIVDEASMVSTRASARGSKMLLSRQAKSERFLGSSTSSVVHPEQADDIRLKPKPKQQSGSRGRTGTYGSLYGAPSPPSTTKTKLSAKAVVAADPENTNSDQGMPGTASGRKSATGPRGSRPPVAKQMRLVKSQSLRHFLADGS
jgi:hypothetical protein